MYYFSPEQRLLVQNDVQSKVDQFPQLQLPGVQQVAVMHQVTVLAMFI